jgi:hypothetical protein
MCGFIGPLLQSSLLDAAKPLTALDIINAAFGVAERGVQFALNVRTAGQHQGRDNHNSNLPDG